MSNKEWETRKQELKNEIIEELKNQKLKNEIISELKPLSKVAFLAENSASRFIVGFVLTGCLGTWLSTYWQNKQWSEQQTYMAAQKSIEGKYSLIEEVSQAIAEAYTPAEDILGLITYWNDKERAKEVSERIAYWRQSSRGWRISSKILVAKLNANFKNVEIKVTFDDIINRRRIVGVGINSLLSDLTKSGIANDAEITRLIAETTAQIDTATGLDGQLRYLIKIMIEEARDNQ